MALLLTAVTITLSVLPADKLNQAPMISIPYADKIGHMIAYLSLGFVWLMVFYAQKSKEIKTLLFLFSLGLLIEMTQFYFLVGRYFEILDIIANISGTILGIVLCRILYRKKLH
ncbi:MAG: VanZ family protein [Saprospiraceae bacterium]|nr:VanZ family protein [Saprospiraceae bacterium]